MKKTQRYFFVGSKWLYYKLYMGSKVSDKFITKTFAPLAQKLLDSKKIEKWFFINYNDPERHVRIRLEVIDPNENLNDIIQMLRKAISPYVEKRTIHKVQIDTYKRELERYGTTTIEEAETLFFYNSKLINHIITHTSSDDERWLWGLKSIDFFLESWNLTLTQKKLFFENLKDGFALEMGANKITKKQLAFKYRNYRPQIVSIMESQEDSQFLNLLENCKEDSKAIIATIRNKRKNTSSMPNIIELLESFVHMHCNRLFKSNHRLNEWVVYDFMFQYYRSKEAQLRKRTERLAV